MADPYRGRKTERWDFEPTPKRRLLSRRSLGMWNRDLVGVAMVVVVAVCLALLATAWFIAESIRRG